MLDGRSLSEVVLITTMCSVEQTLNARTPATVSDDPYDLKALTQNHFLLGRANLAISFQQTLNVTQIRDEFFECRKLVQL